MRNGERERESESDKDGERYQCVDSSVECVVPSSAVAPLDLPDSMNP